MYGHFYLLCIYFVYCGQHRCDLVMKSVFLLLKYPRLGNNGQSTVVGKHYPTDDCPLCCVCSLIVHTIHIILYMNGLYNGK